MPDQMPPAPTTIPADALTLAVMICGNTEALLRPDEFLQVQNGTNPHDLYDANVSLFGAWAGLYFADPDPADEATASLLNAAVQLCVDHGYDRAKLRALQMQTQG